MEPEPPKRRPGRPSSGVPRKEQIRLAVQKHRRKSKFGEGALLQIELPFPLMTELKAIADREKLSLRELITRYLADAWKADYLAHRPEGSHPGIDRDAAEAMIAHWQAAFADSFRED